MRHLLIALATVFAATAASADERTVTVEVTGLTCPSCPYIAADAIKAVETAQILEVDYDSDAQRARYTVTFDDDVVTAEALAEASDGYGYPGRLVGDDNS